MDDLHTGHAAEQGSRQGTNDGFRRRTPLNTRRRRSRAKRRSEWEEEQFLTGAPYVEHLREIPARFPSLTPQEVRVCACIKLGMHSWQIAEKFSINEKSVEELRRRARRKLKLKPTDRLYTFLAKI